VSYKATSSYILKWKLRKLVRRLFPVSRRSVSSGISGIKVFNRILNRSARDEYRDAINMLFKLVPGIMSRKISEANVQQAFVLDAVQKCSYRLSNPRILCVGCFEDSAAEALERLGYRIEGIDPVLNYDLNTFFHRSSTVPNSFDVVFSTSVIEHVENDELFIEQIASLLAPGGTAIVTCDYNDQYKQGDPIPIEDFRLYTQKDFRERLLPLLTDCELVDDPQWECAAPDFTYAGCRYTFASLVFRKNQT
jgi:SAM-dependent methyltransferase